MQIQSSQDLLSMLVDRAVRDITGQGWNVVQQQTDELAMWHLIARKGERWRVIQVVPPATAPSVRQSRRLDLGNAVRMPARAGSMEQWLAHVRPDGQVSFGPYLLNAQRWANSDEEWLTNGGMDAVIQAASTNAAAGSSGRSSRPATAAA